jgi:two-component system, OmpR family, phosphate regulon sensor histidine kinase PhoR
MISVAAIILTLIFVTIAYYQVLKKQVMADLKTFAELISLNGTESSENIEHIDYGADNIRVTLIDDSGKVLYDSIKQASEMENHSDRPEFISALKSGRGEAVRRSQTLDANTFYYAVKLSDGNVLRVAREAYSIMIVFESAAPAVVGICLFLILVCSLLAYFITKRLIKPIEQLAKSVSPDGDAFDISDSTVYSEIKPFIDTIKKQHEDIMSSTHVREEFTANVSHELKTPLTSISGYAELIENKMASGEDAVRFAGEIKKSAQRLLTLINDIIKLSRLDQTSNAVVFEKISLSELARSCSESLMVNAQRSGIALSFENHACRKNNETGNEPGDEACYINGNREMLEELMYNLTANAIQYNNKGGSVKLVTGNEDGKEYFRVEDDGIGISKENQERIFERFYRVDRSRSKATGGTGLGLAIVKHIVLRHNASIEVKSEMGTGTVFTVKFNRFLEV